MRRAAGVGGEPSAVTTTEPWRLVEALDLLALYGNIL